MKIIHIHYRKTFLVLKDLFKVERRVGIGDIEKAVKVHVFKSQNSFRNVTNIWV